ncbi:hypothetical protein G6F40_016349 [Rhizopus arrhizus]|nr:hypothetical protein G6F40_016349 [Rhizopus arrhizus]KAG1218573.1 hypothetical protein G6F68_021559 [Rhizopus microsporus]
MALPGVNPFPHLAAGLVDDPFPDGQDQAGLFGDGNELVRADQTARGVVPAQQCFGAHDGARGGFVLGLVVQHELVALLRQAQVM